jgi:hypothetical protein
MSRTTPTVNVTTGERSVPVHPELGYAMCSLYSFVSTEYEAVYIEEVTREASVGVYRPDAAATALLRLSREFGMFADDRYAAAATAADLLREAIASSRDPEACEELLAEVREVLFGTREEEVEIARLHSGNKSSIPALRMEDLPHGQWDRRGFGPEKAVLGKARTGGGEHLQAITNSRAVAGNRALRGGV